MSVAYALHSIPRRFRTWVFVWTPALILVLELIWYPKNRYVNEGLGRVLGGFVDGRIASFPAWALLGAALAVLAWGTWYVLRDAKLRPVGAMLIATGTCLLSWSLLAGGVPEWSFGERLPSYGWLFQGVVVSLVAATLLVWASVSPEKAELLTRKLHQQWRIYRTSWQGIAGLAVILFFVLIALLAPFLAAHTYLEPTAQLAPPFSGPERSYYLSLGTDEQGMSLFAEWVWSTRISLSVGFLATIICALLGTLIGIGAGFFGGWRGEVGMRTTDFFLVLPWLPLAMVLAAAWGRSYGMIIVIIGITSWPGTARLVRAETLKVRELQYVERARAVGSKDGHTMRRHILPNVLPLILANTVLVVAIAILSETTLSFLGLGDPLNFSWGTMLRNAWLSGAAAIPEWAYLIMPGASIVLVVVAFTFVGQSLDAVLDPKLRKREHGGETLPSPGAGGSTLGTQPGLVLAEDEVLEQQLFDGQQAKI